MNQPDNSREPISALELGGLAVIVVIGAILRILFMLQAPGFFYDEAIYALDGLRVLRDPGWPIFFDTLNHMREPLFIYLLAATQGLFGVSVEVARGTATLVGVLTIPVVWALAREWRGPAFALFAAFLFATLRWHVHFSGLCFRTITSPLLASLVVLFFMRLVRTRSWRDAICFGAALGVGAYTYLSFRLFPFIVLPAIVAACLPGWRWDAAMAKRFAASVGVAALIFLPLGVHFARHPDHFTGRSDEVSIFSQPGLILKQARDVALMGIVRGDHVGKHNLPGPPRFLQLVEPKPEETAELWDLERAFAQSNGTPAPDPHGTGVPVFFLLSGLFFYAGCVAVSIRAWRSSPDLLLISWLVVGSLASVLSFGAPNMLRLLYLSPAAVLLLTEGFRLAAAGFSALASRIGAAADPPRAATWIGQLLIVGVLGPLVLLHVLVETERARQWPTHPMVPVEFNTDLAGLGEYLRSQPDRQPARLPEVFATHPTLLYVADGLVINPPVEALGRRWWEFEPALGMAVPAPVPGARPVPSGRTYEMRLPGGVLVGRLVELERD